MRETAKFWWLVVVIGVTQEDVTAFLLMYIYIYIYIKKQLMVASGQQRMPLRQEDQRFTVQASLHGIKTR